MALAAALVTGGVWLPFLHPQLNLWPIDDAEIHLFRLYEIDRMVSQGVFYPRWLPDLFLGFGSPLSNFYAPGFYYFAGAIHRITSVSLYGAVQLAGALAVCLGAAGMALLVWRGTRSAAGGVLAGGVYCLSPYPFTFNLLSRGAFPEALALGLLPWVIFALVEVARASRPKTTWTIVSVTLASAALLVHNMLGPLTLAIGFTSASWVGAVTHSSRSARLRVGSSLIAVAVSASLLTAFFWLPVLLESRFVKLSEEIVPRGADFSLMLINPLGSTPHTRRPDFPHTPSGPLDLHTYYEYTSIWPQKVPWSQAAPLVMVAAVLLKRRQWSWRRGWSPGAALAAAAALTAAGAWVLTTTLSLHLWQRLTPLQLFQLPYRFLGPTAFGLAVLYGWALACVSVRAQARALLAAAALALLIFNALGARPLPVDAAAPRALDAALLRASDERNPHRSGSAGEEYVPRTVQIERLSPTDRRSGLFTSLYPPASWIAETVLPVTGEVTVNRLTRGGLETRLEVTAGPGSSLYFHQFDFPGWRAYVDGVLTAHGRMAYRDDVRATLGFIALPLPPGRHEVVFRFEHTPSRVAGGLVSGLFVAVVLLATSLRATGLKRPARLCIFAAALVIAFASVKDAAGPLGAAPRNAQRDVLVADLAHLTRAGLGHILSPSGAALGPAQFADVRFQLIGALEGDGVHGGRLRRWLYLHPPSAASYDLDVPPDAVLRAGLALDPSAWSTAVGDGVRFVVEAEPIGSSGQTRVVLLDRVINPRANLEERQWNDVVVPLTQFAGQRVRLTLRTDARDEPSFDWSGWGNPVVVVQPGAIG